jgi:6-phosphogluconolactonase (cycloisomerase 2 family)
MMLIRESATVSAFALILLTGCDGSSGSDIGGQPLAAYAYVTSAMGQSGQAPSPGVVYEYVISQDGTMTQLSNGSAPCGAQPTAIVADPTGHYVYVVNQADASISQFAVNFGGTLTALAPAINVTGPSTNVERYAASIDPGGHFLYVVAVSMDLFDVNVGSPTIVSEYSIGGGGALTPLNPAYITVPFSAASPVAFDPAGRYAYLTGDTAFRSGQVAQFSLSAAGQLESLTPSAVQAPATPTAATFLADGRTVYILSTCADTNCDGQITTYSVGSNGELTAGGATTTVGNHVFPLAMVTNTAVSSAYVLADEAGIDTGSGAIYQYTLGSLGELTPHSPASLAIPPSALLPESLSPPVAESVLGSFLYALSANTVSLGSNSNTTGGHIDRYAIGSAGTLTAADSVKVPAGVPTAMALVVTH